VADRNLPAENVVEPKEVFFVEHTNYDEEIAYARLNCTETEALEKLKTYVSEHRPRASLFRASLAASVEVQPVVFRVVT
jgi:hypothetical protein